MSRDFSRFDDLQDDFYEACRKSYIAHKNYDQHPYLHEDEFRQKAEEAWNKCLFFYAALGEEMYELRKLNPEEDDFLRVLESDRADICKRFDSAKEQHYDLFDSDEGSDSSPSEDDDDLVSISNEEPEEH